MKSSPDSVYINYVWRQSASYKTYNSRYISMYEQKEIAIYINVSKSNISKSFASKRDPNDEYLVR